MDRKEQIKQAGIRRYGSEEAWRNAMREHGSKADRSTPRGFSRMDKELQREISKKGGNARWAKEKATSKEDQLEDGHFTKKDLI